MFESLEIVRIVFRPGLHRISNLFEVNSLPHHGLGEGN